MVVTHAQDPFEPDSNMSIDEHEFRFILSLVAVFSGLLTPIDCLLALKPTTRGPFDVRASVSTDGCYLPQTFHFYFSQIKSRDVEIVFRVT